MATVVMIARIYMPLLRDRSCNRRQYYMELVVHTSNLKLPLNKLAFLKLNLRFDYHYHSVETDHREVATGLFTPMTFPLFSAFSSKTQKETVAPGR